MSKNILYALMILVSILCLVVGYYLGTQPWNKPISAHQFIIDNTTVFDTRAKMYLTPKFIESDKISYGKGCPLSATFQLYKEYQFSTWLWQRYGDTEWAMTIWGPGDDGMTYSIEFGRLAGDPFIITCCGQTVNATSTDVAYIVIEVKIT